MCVCVCVCVTAEDMDRLDEALRCTIKKLWPIEGKKMHALLIPPNDGTVLERVVDWNSPSYSVYTIKQVKVIDIDDVSSIS